MSKRYLLGYLGRTLLRGFQQFASTAIEACSQSCGLPQQMQERSVTCQARSGRP